MNDRPGDPDRHEELLDALLLSVSHDLRSPLLAISLSAELIERGGEGVEEATRALRVGATDLERMLQALTLLSRARRREFDVASHALGDLLGGHVVISEVPELASVRVVVDGSTIGELLATLAEAGPVEAQIGVEDGTVRCDFALRTEVEPSDATPRRPRRLARTARRNARRGVSCPRGDADAPGRGASAQGAASDRHAAAGVAVTADHASSLLRSRSSAGGRGACSSAA